MNYNIYKNGKEICIKAFTLSSYDSEKFIFIFHGLFGRAKNWHTIVKKMSLKINECFIVFDLRNHGENNSSSEISYKLMVKDVYNFTKIKNIKNFSIIGHSMGGKLGMLFTLKYPKFIKQLFVVDIAPVNYQFEEYEIIDYLIGLDISKCKSRDHAEKRLSENIYDKNLRIFLLQNLKFCNGNYFWSIDLNAIKLGMSDLRNFSINEKFKSVNTNTICIYGENSSYLNEDNKKEFLKLFTNLKFKKVYNAGHMLHFEKSDEFIEIISKNLI